MKIHIFLIFLASNWAIMTSTVEYLDDKIIAAIPQLPSAADKDILQEAEMEMAEIAHKYGYSTENYTATTKDGFVLNLYRLLPRNGIQNGGYPVLLMHGMFTSSRTWLDNAKHSFPLYLVDHGYDVWLGNLRGNYYTKHVKYSRHQKKFWDFSLDDMIDKDMPTTIDAILEKTGSHKVVCIGDSMGTTVLFGFLSSEVNYHPKVAGFIALSPLVYTQYSPSFLRYLSPQVGNTLQWLGVHDLLSLPPKTRKLEQYLCPVHQNGLCGAFINSYAGFDPNLMNRTRDFIVVSHEGDGLATKVLTHIAQNSQKRGLYKYDYGHQKNLQIYHSQTSPPYNLTEITIPVVIVHAANDLRSDALGVAILKRKLPNIIGVKLVDNPMYTHADMMFAIDNQKYYYEDVDMYMRKMIV